MKTPIHIPATLLLACGLILSACNSPSKAPTPSATTTTLSVNPSSIPADGASTATLTVQLKDADSKNLTASGGTVALSTTAGTLSAVTDNKNGSYTATLTAPTTVGTATISGTLGSEPLSQTVTVSFVAGPLHHFALEAQGGGNIGSQAVGMPFNIQITAQDTNNNTVTGFSDTVDIASSGTLATGGGTTAAFSNGILASHSVSLSNAGSFTLTATRTGGSESGTSNSFVVAVVNLPPSFTKGTNQTVNEDAGPQTITGWATAISPGPANESGQKVTFLVSNNNNALFSSQPAISPAGVLTYTPAANQNGSATVTVQLKDDGGTAGGGVDTSAAQTFTITVNPLNDAPVALAKNFTAQTNMKINLTGLLTGVTDPDAGINGCNPTFTVASLNAVSGGTVSNLDAAAGTFDFDPNPGFTGTAVANYTVSDNGCPGTATSAPATINITVGGPVIWFVNSALAVNGNGTLSNPFNTLAATDAVDAANQQIFLFSGTYTSGLTLNSGEGLVGQGATGASFDALFGITPPAGTVARPTVGGTRPTVQGTLTLATNSKVQGLNLSSTTATGLSGGAVTGVSVSETSVTSTTGTAVSLNGTAGTISLTSVSTNGAATGILLTNTTGSFSVTGNGGTCSAGTPTCTGGTIANSTDSGIKLTNASNINLTRMRINSSGNFGLSGNSVSVLNLSNCVFDGTHGNAIDEGAIFVTNWLTSGTISNSEILGGANDNVRIVNNTGVLNRLTISGSTIRNNSTGANGNHGLRFATNLATNTGAGVVMNLSVTGSTFTNNHSNHIDTGATGQSTMDLVLSGNNFLTNDASVLAGAVNITEDHQAGVTFNVNSNTSNGAKLSAFNFFISNQTAASASMVGRFSNNIIGTTGMTNSGSAQGDGVAFTASGLATLTTNISGNQIRQFNNMGIILTAGDTSPKVNATITGNTIKEGVGFALNAIHVNMGTTSAGAVSACADIGGTSPTLRNDVSGSIPPANFGSEIRVRQRNSSTVQLPGLTGAVDAFLAGRNTVTGNTAVTFTGAFGNNSGSACTQAP